MLPRLESLSLATSNVSDDDLSQLPSALKSLSLNGTPVTDKCMSVVSILRGLTNLDITGTGITADGLKSVRTISTLKTLRVDEDCIIAESVAVLQGMQLSSVEVDVLAALGRETYELLSSCKAFDSRGLRGDQFALWSTALPWDQTLAGVVEAVAAEVGLDSPQTNQLIQCLSDPPVENWATIPTANEFWRTWFTEETYLPDEGVNLATTDDFIRELQKNPPGADLYAVRRYVRERLSADDVPKLLSAVSAFAWSDAAKDPVARSTGLFKYGPFLLVRHGFDNPQVLTELDRLLTDEEGRMFYPTLYAFGYGGAKPFYAFDEWTANEAADHWVLPRLLSICRNKNKAAWLRDNSRMMLTEIALRRPEHVAEVLSALTELLQEDGPWVAQANDPLEICATTFLGWLRSIRSRLPPWRHRSGGSYMSLTSKSRVSRTWLSTTIPCRTGCRFGSTRCSQRCRPLPITAPSWPAKSRLEYLSRREQGQPAGPFSTLLSPGTSEVNRTVVLALLKNPGSADEHASYQVYSGDISPLAALAKAIRDWRAKTPYRRIHPASPPGARHECRVTAGLTEIDL